MNEAALKSLLEQVRQGDRSVDEAIEQLRHLPFEDIGDAVIDHHRTLRQGFPEVIFGANKTVDQIVRIMAALLARGSNVLATRLDEQQAKLLLHSYPAATWHREARCLTIEQQPVQITGRGTILVISAGTSDIPVAAEAVVTARIMGNQVEQLFDVGVAGLHRLLARRELLEAARCSSSSPAWRGRCRRSSADWSPCRSSPCRPPSATAPPSAASPPCSACSTPAPPG